MSKVDFSRGEMSPIMRYRSDLAAYHQGCETLENFLPTPQGGIQRRFGSQIVGDLPDTTAEPAIRTFNLGDTGLTIDIPAPSSGLMVEIGSGIYDTENRIEDIPKKTEIQILLAFSEPNIISAYWLNTESGVPAYMQQLWNLEAGAYNRPTLGFDDTRDVRVVQIENSVYFVASEKVYQMFWSREKSQAVGFLWNNTSSYAVGDVSYHVYGGETYWLECYKAHSSVTISPEDGDGNLYWKVVYPPYLSWKDVTLRVGEKLLTGSAFEDDFDPYAWNDNIAWVTTHNYKLGDVVLETSYYECITDHTAGATFAGDSAYWKVMNALSGSLEEDDTIYRARAAAGREEVIPREIKSHQGRLIVAASSRFPATIFGSEIARPTKFGAGLNDDDPWIYTIAGDRVGKILWMYVTDRLYLGTKGGIYAVDDLITPSQFLLRKINSHSASETEGVSVDGDLMYFQSDRKTLREISYAGSQASESFQSSDMTLFATHLFENSVAIKMVVQNTPHTIVWILRSDGVLVALSYEKTMGMVAFSRHTLDGSVIDISGGTGDDMYAIIERVTGDKKILRIGGKLLVDGENKNNDIYLDGLKRFVVSNVSDIFKAYVQNGEFRSLLEADGIDTIDEIQALTPTLDYASSAISGYISQCSLRNFTAVTTVDLNDNQLTNWAQIIVPPAWTTIDLSSNLLTSADVNQILIDVAKSETLSPRSAGATIDLEDNEAATYSGLVAAIALHDTGNWTVDLANVAGWEDGYTMSFDNTSGTGTQTSIDAIGGSGVSLPDEGTMAKSGYQFVGWHDNAEGTGDPYAEDDLYSMPYDNIVMYANWMIEYTVTYQPNGGAEASFIGVYIEGEKFNLPTNPFTYAGKSFTNWNTSATGSGSSYDEGDEISLAANLTLYAYWDKVIYSVGDLGPGGGYVFYDKGSWSDDWRYMEAAPSGWAGGSDPAYEWSSSYLDIPGTEWDIGYGKDNTDLIIASDGSAAEAAYACHTYSVVFADWFLPSPDELTEMVNNLRGISGAALRIGDHDYYWSSVNNSFHTYFAMKVRVLSGYKDTESKTHEHYVRAVRYLIQED